MLDDTTNDDNSAAPTVEMNVDSEDSDDSGYEYTEEEDVYDDGDYVADEGASHPSYAWWELGE
eukprot:13674339-Ditylum_brightwellii.AAC.1